MNRHVLLISILLLLVTGCRSKSPQEVQWRPVDGHVKTEGKKQALAFAKVHFAESIKGVVVAFEQSDSADYLSHVEYDIVEEGDGYKLTGSYIAFYHSSGRLSSFPGGYFILSISKDGSVKTISAGE
jgi:hypothetical protein